MPAPRPNIQALAPYTPGEQPTWQDTGRPERPVIKLNTNENPYPPSPPVMRAIADVPAEALRLYPPPRADRFRAAAAAAHGLTPDHVIATNGGDELLRMLIATWLTPGTSATLGVTHPSYSLYSVLTDIHGVGTHAVDRDPDTLAPPPVAELAAAWNDANCPLAFFVNPHAPSGRLESLDDLTRLADTFDGLLLIDEAYVDFAPHDAVPLVAAGRDDVVLLRSLSKGYGLAGLRFGYGIAHPDVIRTLDAVRDSYNTDVLAQVAATAALTHRDLARQTWQNVIAERERTTARLTDAGWTVLPSHSNFVLCTPPAGAPDAADLHAALKRRDILIRHFNTPPIAGRLRISIGTPEQMDQLITALNEILGNP